MTTKLANWHHYPLPWRFEEEGYNGGPCVKDANGNAFVILFWPVHPPEQTESAEQETYALGKAIAAVGAQEENTCPKCGTVMCEKFDERPGPNPLVTLAVPNGQFSCMRCGYDPANGMSTIVGEGHGKA